MNGNARDNIKPSQAELQIVLKLYKGEKRSAEQFAKALKDVDKELIEKRSKLEALDVLKFISTHTVDLLINAKALQISQKINYKNLSTSNQENAQNNSTERILRELDYDSRPEINVNEPRVLRNGRSHSESQSPSKSTQKRTLNAENRHRSPSISVIIDKKINTNSSPIRTKKHPRAGHSTRIDSSDSSDEESQPRPKRHTKSSPTKNTDKDDNRLRPKRKSAKESMKRTRAMAGLAYTQNSQLTPLSPLKSPEKKEDIDKEELRRQKQIKHQLIMDSTDESDEDKPISSKKRGMPPTLISTQNNQTSNLSYTQDGVKNKQADESNSDKEYLPDLTSDENYSTDERESSPVPGPSNVGTQGSVVPRRRPPQAAGTADQPIDLDSGDDDVDLTNRSRPNTKITITAANDRIEIRQFYGLFKEKKNKRCISCDAKVYLNKSDVCRACHNRAVEYAEAEFLTGRIRILDAYKQRLGITQEH